MNAFDAFQTPLSRQLLIEASAGSGKTWNLVSVLIRLLLEPLPGNDKPLNMQQIAVVTFTNAAARDLRNSVSQRIAQACDYFYDAWQGDPDPLLDYLKGLPDDALSKARHYKRLRIASLDIEQAAICTIHQFCMRLMRQFGWRHASWGDYQQVDDSADLQEITQDVWSQWSQSLPDSNWQDLATIFPHPGDLYQLYQAQREGGVTLQFAGSDGPDLQQEQIIQDVKDAWHQGGREALHSLAEAKSRYGFSVAKTSCYAPQSIGPAIEQAQQLLDHDVVPDELNVDLLWPFTPKAFTAKKHQTQKTQPPTHRLFAAIEKLYDLVIQQQSRRRQQWVKQLFDEIHHRLQSRMHVQREIGFSEVVVQLAALLQQNSDLAAAAGQQWPVMMVDEFQDTNDAQSAIFQAISKAQQRQGIPASLIMVGDPKQSIYGFRGADIHSYLAVAEKLPRQQQYTLPRNFRSRSDLVEACNAVFSVDSAFMLGDALPFHPATPHRRESDRPTPALQFWTCPADISTKPERQERVANHISQQIEWLSQQGGEDADIRGLADCAVLCDSNADVQQAVRLLQRNGIAAAAMHRDTIWDTHQVRELRALLAAIAQPAETGYLRLAASTPLLWQPGEVLDDPDRDQQRFERVTELARSWRQQGFFATLSQFLDQRTSVMMRLPDGDRLLTNYRQLIELLRHGQTETPIQALATLDNPPSANGSQDVEEMRLPSDGQAVRVMTLHKSKGLQFPFVFVFSLPAISSRQQRFATYHQGDRRYICMDSIVLQQEKARILNTRAAEARRLLYVALTRAQERCYCYVEEANEKPPRGAKAFQGLLSDRDFGPEPKSVAWTMLEAATSHAGISGNETAPKRALAREFQGKVRASLQSLSFSALADHQENAAALPLNAEDTGPGGIRFGLLFHTWMERWFHGKSMDAQAMALVRQQYGYSQQQLPDQLLRTLTQQCLKAQLPGLDTSLEALSRIDMISEMGFHLRLEDVSLSPLRTALQQMRAEPVPALRLPEPINGLLNGFIDLVFRHNGRYYVLDYKTNLLEGYSESHLKEAMQSHDYDLQALLYGMALHHLLQQRLADYAPQRHLGGAFYLFVRGMQPDRESGIASWSFDADQMQKLAQSWQRERA